MPQLRLNKVKYNNLVLFNIFYLLLVLCFALVVKDEYAFKKAALGYGVNYGKLVLSLLIIFSNVILLSFSSLKDFHYSISSLILLFFVFPSGVMFVGVTEFDNRIWLSHNLFFWSVLFLGKIRLNFRVKKIEILQSKKLLMLIVIIGMIPFIIFFAPHINPRNLLLLDIYETRSLLDTTINNLYTDYSYSWFNKFIIPCLLVFGIYFRDRFTILVCTLSLIFLYLCGAHKAVFVGLIVTFVLYKYDYIIKINYFLKILIVIAIFSLGAAIIFNHDFIMTMSIRRAFLLPAMVDVLYFDMFDNNHLYWSEVFNGLFAVYPFEYEHSYIIGQRYFDDVKWGANNGIISDGFMNFGLIGVLINIVIVSTFISILNQLNISPRFFGLFFLFIFVILSSSLTTVLLTHGGIILFLLAFFFMRDTNDQMT